MRHRFLSCTHRSGSRLTAVTVAALLATACTQQGGGSSGSGPTINKEMIGGLAGATAGAIAGSNVGGGSGNVAAIAIGTLLGSKLGSEVGKSLDRADMLHHRRTSQRALETAQPGQTLPWSNPETGHSGSVTPQNYYQNQQGRYCREYRQVIDVGNKAVEGYGTACRQPDGTWEIVDTASSRP